VGLADGEKSLRKVFTHFDTIFEHNRQTDR